MSIGWLPLDIAADLAAPYAVGPDARNEELLAMLSLARLTYDRRADERLQIDRPRRFALLVAIQAEVMHLAVKLVVCTNVANGWASEISGINLRGAIRNFPSGSSKLMLASARLRRLLPDTLCVKALETSNTSLAAAMQATVAMLRFGPGQSGGGREPLAARWRIACRDCIALLDVLTAEFEAFGLSLPRAMSPLQTALAHAAEGDVLDAEHLQRLTSADEKGMRSWRRLAVRGSASVQRHGCSRRVELRDLSGGGVGIVDTIGLVQGEQVVIVIDETIHMAGRVAWSGGGGAGIEFDTPLYDDAPELRFLSRRSGTGGTGALG